MTQKIEIECTSSMNILDLRKKISEKIKDSIYGGRLIHNGSECQDDFTKIVDYKIKNGNTVYLVIR